MIYLDYQATTPLAPEAFEAMVPLLRDQFANPHSAHRLGRAAAAQVEVAREEISRLLPGGGRLIFTSGATEALNIAIQGAPAGDIVTIATEHAAVLDTVEALGRAGRTVTILPVGRDGLVDMDAAAQAILRAVERVQSNAIQFVGGSWLYWPKASEIRADSTGFEVCLSEDGTFAQSMRYEFRA